MEALDLMAWGLAGCENSELLWNDMKNLGRDKVSKREQTQEFDNFLFQEISLSGLAKLVIELLDE